MKKVDSRRNAKDKACEAQLSAIKSALEIFYTRSKNEKSGF